MNLGYFPLVNASLNGLSAVLLLIGYRFIKARRYMSHGTMMIAAAASSTAFLGCYITYHALLRLKRGTPITRFPPGHWRPVYMTILTTHTILAVAILPMVLITLWYASHKQWQRHRAIAVWTFPLWLYVSVTGVIIYWMLYHLAPTLQH